MAFGPLQVISKFIGNRVGRQQHCEIISRPAENNCSRRQLQRPKNKRGRARGVGEYVHVR
eukprot:272516-Amphidinium_carterae.1